MALRGPGQPVLFPGGTLPPRVYGKSGKPVLLHSYSEAVRLKILLTATDKKCMKPWLVGTNENGWWFCYRG